MKYILLTCPTFLFLTISGTLSAQSVDAQRYVNAQGVEVIQSRQQFLPDNTSTLPVKPTPVIKENISNPNTLMHSQSNPASLNTKLQISTKEQAQRDHERAAILNQELANEVTALQTKLKILNSPSMKAKLSDQELLRLQETASAHEQNIRSLNSEINRMSAQTK
ncbi:hypothetical protein AAKU61_004330 [Undibacterium sp. GrIS 1.2]|uniref:hypothetical protein n=1 Tax=Undibacterium sp. GrIS 1.2 TaxID=3143933 RepID=UPI0033944138